MEYERYYNSPASPTQPNSSQERDRHKNHIICFSSCFRSPTDEVESSLVPVRSPSAWIRAKAHEFPDEIRGKCRNFLGRHKRRHSSDFGYDPLSYARNFDDGGETLNPNNEEEFPYRCFSSRLPPSPQPSPRPSGSLTGRIGRELPLLDISKAKGKAKKNDVPI